MSAIGECGSANRIGGRGAPRLPYLPALDGLRALAVIAVLLFHADLPAVRGGFFGVEVFFVISGYLITSLLLAEWAQTGGIDFKGFWLRRARRLLPALFFLLLAVVGFAVVFLPDEVAALRGDVLSSALYVNNWRQVFSHASYFETVGRPPLLRHLWSLAVEEQFYLVWPLLFQVLMRRLRPGLALLAILMGALASSLSMALLYEPDVDPSRLYYGTDTRAAGPLLGAALAFVWPPRPAGSPGGGRVLDFIGLAALGALAGCVIFINEFQAFTYRGGLALVSLTTVVLIAAAVQPRAGLLQRVLSWNALRWVGLRSYGLYLWHFPVFMVTRPQLDVPVQGVPLLLMRVALTTLFATLSYRFVEVPIRQGAIERFWKSWRAARGAEKQSLTLSAAAAGISLFLVLSMMAWFLVKAQPPPPPAYLSLTAATNAPAADPAVAMPAAASPIPEVAPVASATTPVEPLLAEAASNQTVTAIGDSVMRGAATELSRALGGNVVVDAEQGRQPRKTSAVIKTLRAAGKIGSTVIVHIGDNGIFSASAFDQIMEELKDARRVIVLTVKVPRHWESLNNTMLAKEVKSYRNAVLVDWHGASADRPRIFWNDGIHLRPEGARFYAELVAQAVRTP